MRPYASPHRVVLASILASTLILVSAGCKRSEQSADTPEAKPTGGPAGQTAAPPATQPAPQASTQIPPSTVVRGIRAIWVTRMDYKTPEDIVTIMENCRQSGFNHVIFQVRGNGTVFYPSKIEPWAEQFDFQSPGFDPLELACKEAHARGLTLQAWVNVVPAWRGLTPPKPPEQLYNRHPEWFWYDQQGKRQPLVRDFYVSLNPCLPEVREYLVSVFRELATNYPIDALHMDYIRFPNEPPVIPFRSGLDYPRDARTLALYKEATGKAPDDDAPAWNQWRTQQVTRLVADIRAMLREARPAALLTASVGSNYEASLAHFRDDLGWVEAGLLDMAFPMNYKRDVESFTAGLQQWLPLRDRITVVPGLWTAGGGEVARAQIQTAVEATGNFCLFAYASMFESRAEASPADADARTAKREAIVPYVKSLATTRPAGTL